MSAKKKDIRRERRKSSIRKSISGSSERPRLSVSRSLKHIYVQAIDDQSGKTIASASSLNDKLVTSLIEQGGEEGNIAVSRAVGKAVAQRLKEQNIQKIVFDRNGYLYHGRVQALASGAREEGIQF